jgi:predicted acetyltransferase
MKVGGDDITIRKATEDDLDRLIEIHFAAYPADRSAALRRRNFTDNPFGTMNDLVVVEHRGDLVAHAFLFPFRASFGGRPVKMGGIASVGVAPEARGRGVATALLDHLHALSDDRGDALTMLYAFRHGFYTRLGYALTSSRKRLAFDLRSVPPSWRALAQDRVRAARASDRAAIRNVHARAAARSSGWITRPKAFWEAFLARERRVIFVCERAARKQARGPICGYVAFMISREHDHGETLIEVDELIADDDESRRALLGAVARMRDQAAEIVIEVAESDPLERALIDPDRCRFGTPEVEHGLGEVVGGPMVRIEDVPRAIEARGYTGSGSFDVVVRAGDLEDDEEDLIAVGVDVRGGRAQAGPARGGGALSTTRSGLAAILYGGLSVTDAVALGLAEIEPRLAPRVDAITRLAPLAPIDSF